MVQNDGQNLMFIMGLPRSGTTLLSAILGTHSEISCPPEPWFLLRLREVTGTPSFMKAYDDYFARVGTVSFIREEFFDECARAFAVCAYNIHLKNSNRKIMVDKTPRYYHILDFIEKLFPKAIKLWLKRDPLDLAVSYKTTWDFTMDHLTGRIMEPHSFDFTIGLHALDSYFKDDSPYKYQLKYEDLVSDPRDAISRLCDFCKIPFEEQMLQYGKNAEIINALKNTELGDKKVLGHQSAHAGSVGKWRETLSPEEIRDLIGVTGIDVFLRMGYVQTVKTVLEEVGLHRVPTAKELEDIRRSLLAKYDTGILFSWEKQYVKPLRDVEKQFAKSNAERDAAIAKYEALAANHYAVLAERDALTAERGALAAERDALLAERDSLASELDSLRLERNALASHRDALAASREEILHSLSWRLTAPLRRIGKVFIKTTK